ncbi:conserved hypothetical protein [Nitrosomonas mobilis]|uniref:ATP-grasp domain-containing protein n=1 Tax=Nitrosomonas mobilis TaxID=51642 RepID=A0A1G5SEE8_9PROT|nr:conserved hypothetical protein [Nitrosomonas mobilis]
MKVQLNILKRLTAKINNAVFFVFQLFLSRLFPGPKMKILFSNKQDWKRSIKKGFQFTPHEVKFGEFSSENIKDFDLFMPLTIHDLNYLNGTSNLIKHNLIPIPSTKTTLLCDNKYLLNQFLIANNFGSYVPNMGGAQTFPYILKKKIDEWGANTHIILDAQQEQNLIDILNHPDYFTQELISGPTEYATHILIKDQKIVHSINIKYAFETDMPIKGKDNAIYKKVCDCPHLDLFLSILVSIKFQGICCFNYKVYDNHPFIIEINPRIGGSLCPYLFSFVRHIN